MNSPNSDYNIMCVLFDKCNLACTFCFEANKTKKIDYQYLTDLPKKLKQVIIQRKKHHEVKVVELTLMGGEVFNDTLPDSIYDLYEGIISNVSTAFDDVIIKFNWLSNGVFTKRDRVDRLLNNNCLISFSYDCVGRYPSDVQLNMFLNNVRYYSTKQKLGSILITPTKPSIKAYIEGCSDLNTLRQYTTNLDLSYYIAGNNYQQLNPSDNDLYHFYKYLIDQRMFEFKDIRELLKPYTQPQVRVYKSCNCDRVMIVTPNKTTSICTRINSPLHDCHFYGHYADNINEQTIVVYRKHIGETKRGCHTCPRQQTCVQCCWSMVLFDNFEIGDCFLNAIYNLIEQDTSIIDDYNQWLMENTI